MLQILRRLRQLKVERYGALVMGVPLSNAHNSPLYPHRCAQATWFEVGLGACGFENTDSDFIVALSEADWAGGSHCNQVRSTPFLETGGTSNLITLYSKFKLLIPRTNVLTLQP